MTCRFLHSFLRREGACEVSIFARGFHLFGRTASPYPSVLPLPGGQLISTNPGTIAKSSPREPLVTFCTCCFLGLQIPSPEHPLEQTDPMLQKERKENKEHERSLFFFICFSSGFFRGRYVCYFFFFLLSVYSSIFLGGLDG